MTDIVERLRGLVYQEEWLEEAAAEIERLRAAAIDGRRALGIALLADGLSGEIKNRLRTSWLMLGDAVRADGQSTTKEK